MAETIIAVLRAIRAARGKEYVDGLVDMANILAPTLALCGEDERDTD